MIKVSDISFTYGADPIYDKASFRISRGQKVGLVGPNGAGKSTLFRVIIGSEEIQDGKVEVKGDVGYVPQEVKRDRELEKASSIRSYLDPKNKRLDCELEKLLSGLEYRVENLNKKPQKLSGGQKTKLALARALLSEPDILLLDEPTNFMDTAGRKFVMEFLADYPKTLLVVSHDLDLLDKHIDKVLSIEKHSGKIIEYKGAYSDYVRLKKEHERLLKREIVVKQKKIKRMEESLQKKLIKQKSKKGVKQRVVFQKRIEREKAKMPAMPPEIKKFKLDLPEPARVAELPLKAIEISKSFGDKSVLSDMTFSLKRGEKMMLIGKNGAGKSTLIKCLLGVIKPDKGYVVKADNARIGYYSQEFENFDMEKRVLDFVAERGRVHEGRARAFLGRFMFDDTKVKQRIGSLSGGEKTRLSIALLMLENNNVLVLDEPTTYLDPMSQRIILEAIKEYKGTLLLVSHVTDFVAELTPTRVILMPEGRVTLWDDVYLTSVSETK